MPMQQSSRAIGYGIAFACVAIAGSTLAAPITSSNRDVLLPNRGVAPAGGVFLNGTRFINHGLQGVGRLAAASVDPATGETLGSISDLQIDQWQRTGDTYSGVMHITPDRGYNAGNTFSNYAARINQFSFTFTPFTANTPAPSQNQIDLKFERSTRFTYDHDSNPTTAPIFTTGLLPTGGTTFAGAFVPTVGALTTQQDGSFTNRLTLDTEALALDNRPGRSGSGWIGDEYGANVYHFNAAKQIDGVLKLPEALVPHSPVSNVNFNASPEVNGRRINQGMEGIAVHGDKLFALLQSATIQDSGTGNQGRSNTRLVVFDISGSDAPTDPIAQYVIQLPRVDDNGGTPAVNRTAAQSSIIALNDHQLLILSRDGNGRGAGGSPVFKSVLLADISAASNIDGLYDAEGNRVTGGSGAAVDVLSSIRPIAWVEALNMLAKVDLGVTELEQFGLNLNAGPGDINSLSEKWEGLGLVSALDPNAPNDYFLFVGNDNDFITRSGKLLNAAGDLVDFDAGLENDTMLLAYRVTLVPTPIAGVLFLSLLPLLAVRRRCA